MICQVGSSSQESLSKKKLSFKVNNLNIKKLFQETVFFVCITYLIYDVNLVIVNNYVAVIFYLTPVVVVIVISLQPEKLRKYMKVCCKGLMTNPVIIDIFL